MIGRRATNDPAPVVPNAPGAGSFFLLRRRTVTERKTVLTGISHARRKPVSDVRACARLDAWSVLPVKIAVGGLWVRGPHGLGRLSGVDPGPYRGPGDVVAVGQ